MNGRRRLVRLVRVRRGQRIGPVFEGRAAGAAAPTLQVFAQQRHPGKCLAAPGTRVLLNIRVRLQVSPQVRSVGECSTAVVARKRFFSSVGANVTLEEPRSRESLSTQMALAGQCVRTDVHLEGSQRSVYFCAILAAEGFACETSLGGRAVVLLMLRKTGVRGVRLCAVGTLVARASLAGHRYSGV